MSKRRLEVLSELPKIESQLRKDEKFSQGIRLHAVYQIARGIASETLAKLYCISHKSICNWVHRYNSEGVEGLRERPRQGRPKRLNDDQIKLLESVLQSSPQEHGYSTGNWTGALVGCFIEETFGVIYKKAQIYNILNSLGFSFQKARGYYPEIAGRAERLEEIKKTSKPGSSKRSGV